MGFVPSGVITLTTDFGHKGVFAGTMKGQMLKRFPAARIVDITHEIAAHWPDEAGFWLARAFPYFPDGTVHVAVVDPGVGSRRDIIGAAVESQLFLAPDNGLLGMLVEKYPAKFFRLDTGRLADFGIDAPSATFHGRDIFAPLAAELAAGRISPAGLGPQIDDIVRRWHDAPRVDDGAIAGVVLTADTFGNLITNIDGGLVNQIASPVVLAGGQKFRLHRTYSDVQPGEFLALINSFDVIEIAQAERSAAAALGLGRGAPVVVKPAG
ncbi:MAG: SAM-dependent chlorinase/fluorinase [Gammaproteobacteria bacterium]|nr:SAM-dependent chlorinase/fluorinase [Gammaproteobacteria bacterium]